jgi:uncharacterized protein (UPF0248 family)
LPDQFGDIAGQIVGSAQIAAEEANIPVHRVVEHNFSLAGNQLDPDA